MNIIVILWILYFMIGVIVFGYKTLHSEHPLEYFLIGFISLLLWPLILLFDMGQYIRKVKEGN